MTDLNTTLGTKYPIIVGPMAWTSMAPLVSAVGNAGALGVLGVGFAPTEVVEEQIHATQKLTTKPFGINVTIYEAAEKNLQRVTEIAKENNIKFIYADNIEGLNLDYTEKWFSTWHQLGMKVISKVATAEEAKIADECHADVIIAKGREGGGHMTSVGTMALVPEVVDVTQNAAVVASGGIADGRGYAAARMLGADGVEMGTAFLATVEGGVHENVKNAVLNAKEEDLVMTGYSTGAPCWQISNHLSDRLNQLEQDNAPAKIAPQIAELSSGSLRTASQEGDVDEAGAVMPGQIVTLITETKSVSQILADVYSDGVQVLKSAATFSELQ